MSERKRTQPEAEATALLVRARERLASPERWVQGHRAVDATGERVEPLDLFAVRWCATGALEVEFGPHPRRLEDALWHAQRRLAYAAPGGPRTPEFINDEQGHAAVLELFDQAIRIK